MDDMNPQENISTVEDINSKRKAIVNYISQYFKKLDPSGKNSEIFERKIKQMSDKEFDLYMTSLKNKKTQLTFFVPNLDSKLEIDDLIDTCRALGIKIDHRLWLTDPVTGRKFLTPNKYVVLQIPIRRLQQFIDKKIGVPENDVTIDGLTGQVTMDDRANSLTNPEIQMLYARGLMTTLSELIQVRGGNINAYAELKRQLEESGMCDMNTIDPNYASRTSRVAAVLFQSMHLDINL